MRISDWSSDFCSSDLGLLPINSTDYFCLLGNDLVQATNYLAALVKGSNCAITVAPAAHDLPPENFAFLIAMCLPRGCFQAKAAHRCLNADLHTAAVNDVAGRTEERL